jgi:glycosyltransferase involved in cell wall biosynthesis
MSLEVCLIVGDNRAVHCGVKDYARRLGNALEGIGLSAEVLAPDDWGVKSLLRFREKLRRRQFDIVHLQYPSNGNRKSLCPHVLGAMKVARRAVVTLHEHSSLPILQRASTHLFRWTADRVLFTAEAEAMRYGRAGDEGRVIHIGSNVPASPPADARAATVLYFGQIRPNKGLEEFLELAARSLRFNRPFKYQVIGSAPERRAGYYKALRANATPGVEWLIDLPFEQVAALMTGSLAAYLPFPDGASYRRGSLLAALTNGLPAITTVGTATPHDMIDVLLPAASPEAALAHIERLSGAPDEVNALSRTARLFAEKFSWREIARQHEEVYKETLQL